MRKQRIKEQVTKKSKQNLDNPPARSEPIPIKSQQALNIPDSKSYRTQTTNKLQPKPK